MAATFRGLRICTLAVLVLAFFSCHVVDAQCAGSIPAFCSGLLQNNARATYFDGTIAGYTRLTDSEVEQRLIAIDNSSFCGNCRAALKKFVCEMAYPSCTTEAVPRPVFPCQSSCNTIVASTCGLSSITYINFRWSNLAFDDVADWQLKSLGFPDGADGCAAIYTGFEQAYGATTCYTITTVSTPVDCRSSAVNPADFSFCGPYLGSYNSWDLVTRNASVFDEQASILYDDFRFKLFFGTVHQPCPACENELKRAACQAMIPGYVSDSVPVQKACRSSCERVLSTCRSRDTMDPGYLATFRSLGLGAPTQIETDSINSVCSGTEFEQASGSCLAPFPASAPSKCPCSLPPQFGEFDLCKPFVTYDIHTTTYAESSNIETQLRLYLAPYYNISNPVMFRVCPSCNVSLVETLCRMAYPKCTADGVKSARNDSCETMANGICKMPGFKKTCEDWVSGLPTDNSNAEAISSRSACTCAVPNSTPMSNNCKRFVTYPVPYGWQTDSAVTIVSADADKQITRFDQVKSLLCTNCSESIIRNICEAYFPRCSSENHIMPACDSGCARHLQSCNLPGLAGQFCDLLQNEAAMLPGLASCYDSSNSALTGSCNYCGRRQDTGQCREYVDWDTYVGSLPGLDITKFTNLAEFVLPTINFPNCSDCTFQIRRTMCSVFVLPCNTTIVDKLVSKFISLPAGNIATEDALNAVTRPCFSKCQEVLGQCLTTMPPNPKNFFFACDAKLPGLPPNLDLYAKTGDCVVHNYPSLPGSCPLYVAQAPRASGANTPGTNNNNNGGGGAGLSSAGIAGIVIAAVVIPIIIAAAFAVLYIRRLWIFKITRVDLDSIQPDDRDSRVITLEQTDWSKARKPRVVSNLK